MQFTRPRCHCRFECFRMPNRRIPCTTCFHLIGPGCCATNHETGALTGICHCCSQANPQECDCVIKATTGLADEQCRDCGEEHLADEGRRFWQKEWRRITLAIKRRWQTEMKRMRASKNEVDNMPKVQQKCLLCRMCYVSAMSLVRDISRRHRTRLPS